MPLPVVLLLGPTAAGKSALAVHAARAVAPQVTCEIVSVDSALVYRGLDIGAAKPTLAERAGVAHHLLDIRDPAQPYSAGEFRADALACIAAIRARGHLPVLVGGTFLYFRALTHGIAELPPADPALRAALEGEGEARGWAALHARLAALDPNAAARIGPADRQRIVRALEVHAATGMALSRVHAGQPRAAAVQPCVRVILAPPDRAALHRAIGQRVAAMFAAGLVAEVRALRAAGLDGGCPAGRSVGYRQVLEALAAGADPDAVAPAVEAATRALARRQLTWLRGEPQGVWMNPYHPDTPARFAALLARISHVHRAGVARAGW